MEIGLKKELFIQNNIFSTLTIVDKKEILAQNISDSHTFLKNVIFEKGCALHSPAILRNKHSVFIGAHSYMNPSGYIRENVFIGRYCSIGRRVTIGAGMHHVTGLSSSPKAKGVKSSAYNNDQKTYLKIQDKTFETTVIENDVWIGDGVVIMPGVKIGMGSIVGANSVVTKDIEPYSVVVGIPAKHIKFRFPVEIANKLIASKWIELSLNSINNLPCRNIFEFLERIEDQQYDKEDYQSYYVKI